ncbi:MULTISPECIES: hypothetical protein [Pseudofrankia]|uniref:hypothetical protein n=1 Tax=Pseudofrankia TaxID=2994363 RepID=UPI000234BA6B|nr:MULTISPECIES: hypothetical protein [Pseudofrankia]OHV28983.1 hypothetical protein BCD49_37005 [Pseudofrankia sp. EUN1h]
MEATRQKRERWSIVWPEPRVGTRVALAVLYFTLAVSMIFVDHGLAVRIVGAVEFCCLGARALVPWGQSRAWARRHPVLDGTFAFPAMFVALRLLTHLSTGVCALLAIPIGMVLVAFAVLRSRRAASS